MDDKAHAGKRPHEMDPASCTAFAVPRQRGNFAKLKVPRPFSIHHEASRPSEFPPRACHPRLSNYPSPPLNTFLAALLAVSIILIQCLIGGTRLVFSLPAYGLLALGAVAAAFWRPRADAPRPRLECIAVTLVFFAYILGRAALSPVDYLWWGDFFQVLGCLAAYFITAYYLTSTRARTVVVAGLLALALGEVLVGIRQFAVGDDWMPFGLLRTGGSRRASGTLISSIHLAGYLEAVALFALSFALWSSWKAWARILAGWLVGVCYLGVIITGSRGAYLSVLVSLGVFAILSLHVVRKSRPERFLLALATTVALALAAVSGAVAFMQKSPMLRERIVRLNQQFEGKGNWDVRIYNWQAALDQFRTAPAFGTGAGTHVYYGRLFRRPQIQADPIHAHSDYLEMLAEYGIAGLAGMAVFIFIHALGGLRGVGWILRNELLNPWEPVHNDRLALHLGALSAVSVYLAHSLVDFNLHIPGNALLFAFIFGLLANPALPPQGAGAAQVSGLLRWALPVLGVWIGVAGVPKLPGEYWTERARVALRDRHYEDSVEFGQKALQGDVRNPDTYFYLGGAHRGMALTNAGASGRLPHLQAAIEAYQRGLAIFPFDEHMLVRFGEVLDDLGRFREAGEAYRKMISLDPNLSVGYAYYARHLARAGRDAEAEAQFAKAKSLALQDLSPIVRGTILDPLTLVPPVLPEASVKN